MEIKMGQKTMKAYAIYVKTIEYNHDRTEKKETVDLRTIKFDEREAKIELNDILDLFHTIYKINDPFSYERTVWNGFIRYRRMTVGTSLSENDFEFWYDVVEMTV